MNNMTRTLTFFASILFLATPVPAQSTATTNRIINSRFAASDTNEDGRLTKAEAEAGDMDILSDGQSLQATAFATAC